MPVPPARWAPSPAALPGRLVPGRPAPQGSTAWPATLAGGRLAPAATALGGGGRYPRPAGRVRLTHRTVSTDYTSLSYPGIRSTFSISKVC